MEEPDKWQGELPKSRIEVFLKGGDILVSEFYSHNMTVEIVKQLREDYGLEVTELCQSMCG